VQGSGFRVQGSGFRVQGPGFRAQSSGSRVQGSGFGVQGVGTQPISLSPIHRNALQMQGVIDYVSVGRMVRSHEERRCSVLRPTQSGISPNIL